MRFLPLIAVALLLAACYWHKRNPVPDLPVPFFIPGTYAAYEEGHFCVTWDTLVVAAVPGQSSLYRVLRRSAFQRNLGENYFPVEDTRSKWSGLYDGTSKVLRAIGDHPDLAFSPEQNGCNLSGVAYCRVQ